MMSAAGHWAEKPAIWKPHCCYMVAAAAAVTRKPHKPVPVWKRPYKCLQVHLFGISTRKKVLAVPEVLSHSPACIYYAQKYFFAHS